MRAAQNDLPRRTLRSCKLNTDVLSVGAPRATRYCGVLSYYGRVEETVFYGKIGGTASAVVRPMWDRADCVFCFVKKNIKIKIKRGY